MTHVQKRDTVLQTDARWIERGTDPQSAGTARLSDTDSGGAPPGESTGGQTLVEFALIIPVFLLLMLGVVQMVVVGGAALAVNQAAVSCARYASLNPSATEAGVGSYLTTTASPLINDSGLQPLTLSPITVPRTTGTAVTVTVTYNLQTKLFLGTTFFGVTFPSQLSVTQTMTSE
jgi:Flp pilus assembly protein TadG